jgi:hypothetical protein
MNNRPLSTPHADTRRGSTNIALSVATLAVTFWALLPAGLIALRGHRTYEYLNSFVVALVLCALVGVAAIIKTADAVILARNLFAATAFGLFVLTMSHFPGGDDGPGMILVGGTGPAMLASIVLAIVSTVQVLRQR